MTSPRVFVAGACSGALAVFLLLSVDAHAQDTAPKCGPRAVMVKGLTNSFHEVPVAIGMVGDDQHIMEWYASPAGTWTQLLTNAQKVSCIVAFGKNWEWDTTAFDGAKKKGPAV